MSTRLPLVRLMATFSARSLQQMTSRNETDSSDSLVLLSCHRRLTATDRDVVAWPYRLWRISGSRVRLPATVTEVMVAMEFLLFG